MYGYLQSSVEKRVRKRSRYQKRDITATEMGMTNSGQSSTYSPHPSPRPAPLVGMRRMIQDRRATDAFLIIGQAQIAEWKTGAIGEPYVECKVKVKSRWPIGGWIEFAVCIGG